MRAVTCVGMFVIICLLILLKSYPYYWWNYQFKFQATLSQSRVILVSIYFDCLQGRRQKIFQGGQTEKIPKISKNTEKLHYLQVEFAPRFVSSLPITAFIHH